MPFGMKLHFGPAKVVKHQYLGKRKKCGNAARKTLFWTVFYANTFGAHQTETRHRVDDSLSRLACRHTAH